MKYGLTQNEVALAFLVVLILIDEKTDQEETQACGSNLATR
jgi:hypothetical protein